MSKREKEVQEKLDIIVEGIRKLKGEEIKIINLNSINHSEYGYFVICEANSTTQVNAIAESVEETVEESINERVLRVEGKQNATWILLDYGDVIVHVFHKETRNFYNLEGLWADAEVIDVEAEI